MTFWTKLIFLEKRIQLKNWTKFKFGNRTLIFPMSQLKRKTEEDELTQDKKVKLELEAKNLPKHFGKRKGSFLTKPSLAQSIKESEYLIENGLRKVVPYHFNFTTYTKGRWVGKTLRELYTTEFKLYTMGYQEIAVRRGTLKVNHKNVTSLDVVLKDNDVLTNRVHRHECPITDQPLQIVENSDNFLVVNKPCSIPIHPCGRFRFNTVVYILAKEHGFFNLQTFNRIDRMTSGLIIFTKKKHLTNKLVNQLKNNEIQKEYVCKVLGEFPDEEIRCKAKIKQIDYAVGLFMASEDDDAKESETIFNLIWKEGNSSVVRCRPITGRTHQIRVHLQYLGFPIVNDNVYNNWAWGDERFEHGYITKPISDIKQHLSDFKIETSRETFEKIKETMDKREKETSKKVEQNALKALNNPELNSHDSTFDETCHECIKQLPDPKPHELIMFLHAYKYKGPDWEFTAPLPSWAIQKP